MESRKNPIASSQVVKSVELARIMLAIIVGFLIFLSLPLIAEENSGPENCRDFYEDFGTANQKDLPAQFSYGDSCYELESLTKEQLLDLALCKNFENWTQFCHVDDVSVCSQYSYLFDGLGFLTTARDTPNMCRFERYNYQDTGPDINPNFGLYFPYDLFDYGMAGNEAGI